MQPVLTSIEKDSIFRDENARPHHSRNVVAYMQEVGIHRLDWPAKLSYCISQYNDQSVMF